MVSFLAILNGVGCGATTCDAGSTRCVASGVGVSTGNNGGTGGDGDRSAVRSTAGSVDGIDAVSVPIGVAILICCGTVEPGVFGPQGALYQNRNIGTDDSCANVATVGVSGPSRSPNGLTGAVGT